VYITITPAFEKANNKEERLNDPERHESNESTKTPKEINKTPNHPSNAGDSFNNKAAPMAESAGAVPLMIG